MKCPNCGATEQARVHKCQMCGATYTSEDLLEVSRLEFLLAETATWPEADTRSKPYADRLAALKARLSPAPPPAAGVARPPEAVPEPIVLPPRPKAAPASDRGIREPAPDRGIRGPAPVRPAPDRIPFDQWLLSERNIKIALYTGAALLVLAGLIFVGANWERLPGLVKFAVTFMVTGLMYLGGYVLFQRPTLRLGGVALLGVASGFVPLNFVVLQIYIFGERGLSGNAMWLIGSAVTLLVYVLTAYWTRADLFTYLGLGAVASALTAALVLLDAPLLVFVLAYVVLLVAFLLCAIALLPTRLASFTCTPILIVSHLAMPVVFLVSAAQWLSHTGCAVCPQGSPWLALASMFGGVIFYVTTDMAFRSLVARWTGALAAPWVAAYAARWVAAFAFAVTFVFTLSQLGFSDTAIGISLMVLSLAYLLVGYTLERQSGQRAAAWPSYAAGYAVAAFVTLQAIAALGRDPDTAITVLLLDVMLLAFSAWVHRQYEWIYGAAWVFIAPVFIYAGEYVEGLSNQGLLLGVLMLNYAAAGYALGRRVLRLGGPFLTAAAFLSVVVVVLTWDTAAVASLALALIAVLYLLAALWLRWSWLLLPGLAAVNVAVVAILRILFTGDLPWHSLTIIYAGLGVALAVGGAWLRGAGYKAWGWPLYLVAALDLAGSYAAGLLLGGSVAILLSAVFALLALSLAWVEREVFAKAKLLPLLTYLGIALVFVGYFHVIDPSGWAWRIWPVYTAGLCALCVALAWLLPRGPVGEVYGAPLRQSGMWLMLVPLVGALSIFESQWVAMSFAIAGIVYAVDAAVHLNRRQGYLAGGAFIVVIWAMLRFFDVRELQAYVMPLGLGLLGLGWSERQLGDHESYRWSTFLGLFILMGSAFYQSRDAVIYAVLLLVESLAALAWGVRIRSRGYVQLGLLSLVANGIARFGPAFARLDQWVQLAVIGSLLLGGGLAALFRREQLLAARRRLIDEWRQWAP